MDEGDARRLVDFAASLAFGLRGTDHGVIFGHRQANDKVLDSLRKKGVATDAELAGAIAAMTTLNRAASEAMVEAGPSAATDVTGFSFMGHLHEVVHASGLRARVRAGAVPLLPGARRLAEAGLVPGGSKRNAAHFGQWIEWAEGVDATSRTLLCDAQTSGGLLIAIPEARLAKLEAALAARGVVGAVIGACEEGAPGTIQVDP